MADGLTVEMDTRQLFAALDAVGRYAEDRLREVARVTAEAVQAEARRRVRRRTGVTGDNIEIRQDRQRQGYIVATHDVLSAERKAERAKTWAGKPSRRSRATFDDVAHVGLYLEYGTRRMDPRPFFWDAVTVNQSAFDRDVKTALVAAIEESGLGR